MARSAEGEGDRVGTLPLLRGDPRFLLRGDPITLTRRFAPTSPAQRERFLDPESLPLASPNKVFHNFL